MKQTEKKIEDYLHLYLGCECVWFYGAENQLQYKTTVDGIKNNLVTTGLMRFPYTQDVPFETIKPILRPLSDMTEEEALEFINDVFHFRQQFGYRIDNYEIKDGFLSFVYHNGNNGGHDERVLLIKNWGKNGMGEWIFNCSYSMNDVVWLLKKSFDIFGLIESGLALDSTKINPK